MRKRVLVTGAGSGIGRATTSELIDRGYDVIATDLAEESLYDLGGSSTFALDVTDPASIERVRDDVGSIDVLVNSAGVGLLLPIEVAPIESVRRLFDVNVFGTLAVTKAFLPGMRTQGNGRIVTMSSVAGRRVRPPTGYYSATKHAVEAIMESLRYEVRPLGIDVMVIEPGWVDTAFGRHRLGSATLVEPPYDEIMRRSADLANLGDEAAAGPQPVEEVAVVVATAIEAPAPAFRWPTSAVAEAMIEKRRTTPDHEYERTVLHALWA